MPRNLLYTKRVKITCDTPLENKSISQQILENIGTPDDLVKIEVKPIHNNHFRINVYRLIKESPRIKDSFYVETDSKGEIISSSPPMVKKYYTDSELNSLANRN